MPFIKKEYRRFDKNGYRNFILGGDIGGTNIILGIFGIKKKMPVLLLSFHFKTKELMNLSYAIYDALNYIKEEYNLDVTKACFAVAGILSQKKDYVTTQNLPWDIDKNELLKKTKLAKIILINDFEAIGYGINMLGKTDIVVIKKAKKIPKAPIVVIGAGTGLGKTTLLYSEQYKSYIPVPSEAGHMDFPAQNKEEFNLANFIKKQKKLKQNVSYEQVLSGQGLENIYLFLRKNRKFKETNYTKEIDKSKNKPEVVSKYRKIDRTCSDTFRIFKIIYAVFARNFALDCLPEGGIYIAGGIAPRNRDIFDRNYIKIFENNHKLAFVLKRIPIYLISNYNVGLLGVGFAGAKFLK